MGFFGSCFAFWTLFWHLGVRGAFLAAPFILFAMIALGAVHILRSPGQGLVPSRRVAKVIAWSTAGEVVGILVAANILTSLHKPELMMSVMALIVGLHFLPIAFVSRFRSFWLTACALLASSIVGFGVGQPLGGTFAGFAAAVTLWLVAGLALARDRRKRAEDLRV